MNIPLHEQRKRSLRINGKRLYKSRHMAHVNTDILPHTNTSRSERDRMFSTRLGDKFDGTYKSAMICDIRFIRS